VSPPATQSGGRTGGGAVSAESLEEIKEFNESFKELKSSVGLSGVQALLAFPAMSTQIIASTTAATTAIEEAVALGGKLVTLVETLATMLAVLEGSSKSGSASVQKFRADLAEAQQDMLKAPGVLRDTREQIEIAAGQLNHELQQYGIARRRAANQAGDQPEQSGPAGT
jgi:hypothetical protein